MKMHRPLLAVLLAFAATAATAQMYRWVDKDGRVHYTQTPPPGLQAESVRPAPPPSQGGDGARRYLEESARASAEQAKKQAEEQVKQDQRTAACNKAQATRNKLQSMPLRRLVEQDDQGQVTRMTPDKHAELLAEAEAAIGKNCNPS